MVEKVVSHSMAYYESYSYFGIKRFILALGYGDYIKQYFYNYKYTNADFLKDGP